MIEEVSPCKDCKNAGIDKRLCLDHCHRLKAYQDGKDYTKEEIYTVPEGKDLTEDINGGNLDETDIANEDIDTFGDEMPDNNTEALGYRHIVPEPGWKKTVMPEPKKEVLATTTTCPICGKSESSGNRFLRGVCSKPCYRQWYSGKIEHPVLGKFKPAPKDWHPQKVAVLPKSPDNDVDDDICVSTINVDLKLYPLLHEAIYRMAVSLALPVSHIAVTLLAEALENRRKVSIHEKMNVAKILK
jgi:hypothetical protein